MKKHQRQVDTLTWTEIQVINGNTLIYTQHLKTIHSPTLYQHTLYKHFLVGRKILLN